MAVPVGVDDDVDEVRVVERGSRAVERLVGVLPRRGPGVPQIPDDVASVHLQPLPAALGVEVPLIPEPCLAGGRPRTSRGHGVLHRIPADGHLRAHPVGVQDGRDARRPIAPVEPRQRELLQPERVGKVDDVLGNRGLLRHARSSGIAKPRRPVATKVGHEHPVARVDQGRKGPVPGTDIVGKPVQEDDGVPCVVPAFFVANVEHRGRDDPHVLRGTGLGSSATDSCGATGHRRSAHDTRALQKISSALGHDESSSFSLGNSVDYRHTSAAQSAVT